LYKSNFQLAAALAGLQKRIKQNLNSRYQQYL